MQNENVPDSDRVSRSCSEVDVVLGTQNLWIHSSHGWSLLFISHGQEEKYGVRVKQKHCFSLFANGFGFLLKAPNNPN